MKQPIIQLLAVAMALAFTSCGRQTPPTRPNAAAPVYYYDFTGKPSNLHDPAILKSYYDEIMTVTALQGLVNRDAPNIFIRHLPEADDFWWEQMTKPGDWLEGREIKKVTSLDDLLAAFPQSYKGLVVWDEAVPATSNVALSVAGVDDLLPVRFDKSPDSLFSQLIKRGIEPKVWLINQDGTPLFTGKGNIPGTETASSGSAKNDAYRWLLHHYGDKVDPERISYHLDSFWMKCWFAMPHLEHAVPNADYFVAHGAIRCDLHVFDDEATVDDPGQKPGTDFETLKMILGNSNQRLTDGHMIQFAGFTPWGQKYSNQIMNGWNPGGARAPLQNELRLAELITSFNAYMDGDAPSMVYMANASFYQHYPVPEVVPQTAPEPTRERLIADGILDANGKIKPLNYYTYYIGDYDGSSWLLRMAPKIWNGSARGELPASWAFNPNLADRFAYGMMWFRRHASPKDCFVSGDSGAGYVNPGLLEAPRKFSGLPDGMDRWAEHCRRYFKKWDLDTVGYIIDADAPPMSDAGWEAYRTFAPGGVVTQGGKEAFGVRCGVPYCIMGPGLGGGGPADNTPTVTAMFKSYFQPEGYTFTVIRSVLVPAARYKEVDDHLRADPEKPARLEDLPTLLWLIREYTEHRADYPSKPSYAEAAEVATEAPTSKGIAARVGGQDGLLAEVKAGPDQAPAWKFLSPYIYFDVDNDFANSLKGQVEAEVTYLDQGTGTFVFEYDAADNAYKTAGGSPKLENSGTWKTARFALPDPKFSNRQNGNTDLRINTRASEPLVIRAVKITRLEQ